MRIEINISNKAVYAFLTILLLAVLGIGVYAFGTANPQVFGHSVGEIDWTQPIPQGISINGNIQTTGSIQATGDILSNGIKACLQTGLNCPPAPVTITNAKDLSWGEPITQVAKFYGSVGIGTANPTDKLEVFGNIRAAGFVESALNGFKFPDGTIQSTAANSVASIIWTDSSIDGTHSGWKCIQPPFNLCRERGCRLKMKSTKMLAPNQNYIYAYSGVVDKNDVFFSFSEGADNAHSWRWWLNDNVFGGYWQHVNIMWLGDCRRSSAGSCTTLDEMNLCGYQGYKLEAILIKY